MPFENLESSSAPPRTRRYCDSAKWTYLPVSLCLLLFGCGPGKPELVPVAGKVTVEGKALPLGSIQFITEGQRPAYGNIGSDGSFTLETDGEKGCVKGKHKVVIVAEEIIGSPEKGEESRALAPPRYGDVRKTDIEIEVDGPKSDLTIDLKKE